MTTTFKEYIAQQMVGKSFHFVCDCVFPMDFIGTIKGYDASGSEIIFKVEAGNKMINIGENHPKLKITPV